MNKYRNVKFIKKTNMEYRKFVERILKKKKALRDEKTGSQPKFEQEKNVVDETTLPRPSRKLGYVSEECLKRILKSSANTVLSFEFFRNGIWQKSFIECDLVCFHSDGSIRITEVKTSGSLSYVNKALRQLQRIGEILSYVKKPFELGVIHVSPIECWKTHMPIDLSHKRQIGSFRVANDGTCLRWVTLSLEDLLSFGKKYGYVSTMFSAKAYVEECTEKFKLKQEWLIMRNAA